MKKVILAVAVFSLFTLQFSLSQAQEVKIKKGKATMSEAYYNELKAKADAYEKTLADLTVTRSQLREAKAPVVLRNFNDSASYAIGRDIYNNWEQQRLGIDGKMAGNAMIDGAKGLSALTDAESRPLLQRFQQDFERRQRAGVQDNIDAGAKFMQQISNNKSVYTTPSGLKYQKLVAGNGKKPKSTDRVKVHYTGKLIDGTTFDSSVDRGEPITFALNQVIPGWTEGLQLMDEGSRYMLYIPYNLGYGEQPVGSIPAGSTLVFEVELLEINPK
ncbi:MAG: FKBP-type peptidyl-prolyl cis-trans isomerase [Bacteroidales bacterium]|nr:FKBP-type peptidyl-prolyl cis-trans isomerase [Bacteroidales bacterium]MBR6441599.1 FKBP-type peptidyl-prolyl cis-trans isomerase [Bacteroidales bacterium]